MSQKIFPDKELDKRFVRFVKKPKFDNSKNFIGYKVKMLISKASRRHKK